MNKPADPRATKLLLPKALRDMQAKVITVITHEQQGQSPKTTEPTSAKAPAKGRKQAAKTPAPAAPTSASAPAAKPPKPYSPFGARVRKTLDVETVEARAAELKAADADDTPFDVPTEEGKMLHVRAPRDWDAIHAVYRTGAMIDAELCRRFGIDQAVLCRKVKRLGWTRDQRENTLKRALGLDADQIKDVKPPGSGQNEPPQIVIEQQQITATTQDVIIEVLARAIARTRTEHRTGIKRFRALTERLFEDLEATVLNRPDFQTLGQLLADPEADGNLDAIYNGIISLPGQTKTLKELADVLYKLIDLERIAYRLDDPEVDPSKTNRGIAVRFVEPVVRVLETTEAEKQHEPLKLMKSG